MLAGVGHGGNWDRLAFALRRALKKSRHRGSEGVVKARTKSGVKGRREHSHTNQVSL